MKRLLIIGGTGGLGSLLTSKLESKYEVVSVGSKNLDVTNMKACEQYFNDNHFDIVLNFAGVNYDTMVHKLDSKSIDKVNKLVDVNIKGAINVVSSCIKSMRKNAYGRIILISSVLAEKNVMGTSIYSASKSFLDKFVKNISQENIKYGVTSNTLQLGYFAGGMTYKIPETYLDEVKKDIGLNRFGSIDELAKAVDFLIQNEYVTGINLKIDGGLR